MTPNPSGATETVLEGVSCAAWNACVGVGYESDYFDFWDGLGPQGGVLPYAVRWNGS